MKIKRSLLWGIIGGSVILFALTLFAYARCDKGQAELTEEQIETVTRIIEWAKQKAE